MKKKLHTTTTADIPQPFHSDSISNREVVYSCTLSNLNNCSNTFMTANLSYINRIREVHWPPLNGTYCQEAKKAFPKSSS